MKALCSLNFMGYMNVFVEGIFENAYKLAANQNKIYEDCEKMEEMFMLFEMQKFTSMRCE